MRFGTAGPPRSVLPYTTVALGCESTEPKTGVAGSLRYHVHANDTAVAVPGWPTEPVRVAVSWETPFFGKPTCASEIIAAPSLGRTNSQNAGYKGDSTGRSSARGGARRSLVVQRSTTGADHSEVTFTLCLERSTASIFSSSSLGNDGDVSRDEVSVVLRNMDAVEL